MVYISFYDNIIGSECITAEIDIIHLKLDIMNSFFILVFATQAINGCEPFNTRSSACFTLQATSKVYHFRSKEQRVHLFTDCILKFG